MRFLVDTSFAIHPEKNNTTVYDSQYRDIGEVLSHSVHNGVLNIKCEGGFVAIAFYNETTVRIVMNPHEAAQFQQSAALHSPLVAKCFQIEESDDAIALAYGILRIHIAKHPLRVSIRDEHGRDIVRERDRGMGKAASGAVICYKQMDEEDYFYGFGEKTSFLNKRGEKMTMWNSDVYAPHNPEIDSLYQSIPFFVTLRGGQAHGLFLHNTWKTVFDMKSDSEAYCFSADGGQLDYFVFAGPTVKDVLKQYSVVTGTMSLPPKWALGYHQSRYSYQSAEEVLELVHMFEQKNIPLSAVHLDIHYMNGYRVFTFDESAFPDPQNLVQTLREKGIHIVPIVDPGVKKDPEYSTYQEGVRQGYFCKYLEGQLFIGEVWPGESAFPDFANERVRKWWAEQHRFYTDMGIDGIWNDMNEPAVFNETKTMDLDVVHDCDGTLKTHEELHNIYGLLMGKATYEGLRAQLEGKRPFLLTRAGFAGIQRYATVWTGDNRSFWEHLQMALPMCMNLGMSGVPFSGSDVGGFAHDATGELFVRWTQAGAFMPFFRNHSALESRRQEPWVFGEEVEDIVRSFIQLRYTWMPYLYTQFADAGQTSVPVMRPLVVEYPHDEQTYNLYSQFMVGERVLVAPVLTPSTEYRAVYLPEGVWFDYWTNERYEGEKHHLIHAPIDRIPVFVKEGTVLPHECEGGVELRCYVREDGSCDGNLYHDDGLTFAYENGDYALLAFNGTEESGELVLKVKQIEGKLRAPLVDKVVILGARENIPARVIQ